MKDVIKAIEDEIWIQSEVYGRAKEEVCKLNILLREVKELRGTRWKLATNTKLVDGQLYIVRRLFADGQPGIPRVANWSTKNGWQWRHGKIDSTVDGGIIQVRI